MHKLQRELQVNVLSCRKKWELHFPIRIPHETFMKIIMQSQNACCITNVAHNKRKIKQLKNKSMEETGVIMCMFVIGHLHEKYKQMHNLEVRLSACLPTNILS
jgi:hypothetical protein